MPREIWPCTIIFDRYSGTYSGGEWLAFPLDASEVPAEVSDGDAECLNFWGSYKEAVGKGKTPNSAVIDLGRQLGVLHDF